MSHTGLALSIRQPWANEIFTGAKMEEYRTKPTHLRGRIYVYASLTPDRPDAEQMPRGLIIGEVTLYDCRDDGDRFAWLLKDPVRWDVPKAAVNRANPVWFRPWGERPDADVPSDEPTPSVDAPLPDEATAPKTRPQPPTQEDLWEKDDPICFVRQFFAEFGAIERSTAISGLARAVGYQRTGSLIAERIDNTLRTAVRRGILQNVNGELSLVSRSLDGLDRGHLKEQFCASLGRQWLERDDAIRDFARWMGFRRTGSSIDETCRSLIRGLIREGRLEADGTRLRRL